MFWGNKLTLFSRIAVWLKADTPSAATLAGYNAYFDIGPDAACPHPEQTIYQRDWENGFEQARIQAW